ncbi:hypothetical protein EMCRGX_G021698 [Ephydatia muelleri]
MSSENPTLASSDACVEYTMSFNVETEDVRLTVHVDIRTVVQLDVKVNKKQADPLQGAMLQKLVESIQACGVPFQIWQKDSGSSALSWTSLGGAGMRKVLSKLPAYFKDILPQDCSKCFTQLN